MYEEAFEIALQETAIDFKVLLVALALGALGVARVAVVKVNVAVVVAAL